MQFYVIAIISIAVSIALYRTAVSFFPDGYSRFFSKCYLVTIWLFIIFLIVPPYFNPAIIGNESLGYFLIYAPLFALLYLLPALLSLAAAHIACKIKCRKNKDSAGTVKKIWWVTIILYPISHLLSGIINPLFHLAGVLLLTIVSIRSVVNFISQKIKQRLILSAKEKVKIIIAAVGIFIFLSPVLLLSSAMLGRPVESFFVQRRMQAYVTRLYPELDLRIGRTQWGLFNRNFITRIYYRNNDEIFFDIHFSNQDGISDNYSGGGFWAGQLRVAHLPYVEERFGEELRSFEVSVRGLHVGRMPHRVANLDVRVNMELTIENLSPITISEVHFRLYEILQQSEIPFTNYSIVFFLPDGRRAARVELHARHIDEDLPGLIEYLQNNLDDRARYVDRERGTSYWAFLDD
jgi:hypothetical protein